MRIEFDRDACTGHGRCWSVAAEFYDADDDGYCVDPSGEVPPEHEQAARLGAMNCPEQAITVID